MTCKIHRIALVLCTIFVATPAPHITIWDTGLRSVFEQDTVSLRSISNLNNATLSQDLTPQDWACLDRYECATRSNLNVRDARYFIEAQSANVGIDDRLRLSLKLFNAKSNPQHIYDEAQNDHNIERFQLEYEDEFGDRAKLQYGTVMADKPVEIHRGIHTKLELNQYYTQKMVYILPIKLPCWVRWIHISILGQRLRFPYFAWGRRCCKRQTGFGSWFSNSSGCFAGTGPFTSEYQCRRTCGPFEVSPPPPAPQNNSCTFGDGTTWAHGHTEPSCAGTSCVCNNGTVTCDDCRNRYEIHDVHPSTNPNATFAFEQKIVESLLWVAQGCITSGSTTCAGWLDSALQNHLTYGGVAHGNSQFLPWHRAYLKTLEEKMQGYHPCVTVPYWDWSIDQVTTGNYGWTQETSHGQEGLWGYINANSNSGMGEFTTANWPLPGGWPVGSRSTFNNPSSLISAATMATYLARVNFGGSNGFRQFEGPHGGPHVQIGGNMGNGKSPADPIFWMHHAGVDRLWYEWQLLHGTPTAYDADPTLLMAPFGISPSELFDSRVQVGVCYAPPGTSTATALGGSRRALTTETTRRATAIEYGLIAAMKANLEEISSAQSTKHEASLSTTCSASRMLAKPCGNTTECHNCMGSSSWNQACTESTCLCFDSWFINHFVDPKSVQQEECTVQEFILDREHKFATSNANEVSHVGNFLIGDHIPLSILECNKPHSCGSTERWNPSTCSCEVNQRRVAELNSLNSLSPVGCHSIREMWKQSTCHNTCKRI